MEQITPLLQKWLRNNLLSMGLLNRVGEDRGEQGGPAKKNKKRGKGRMVYTPQAGDKPMDPVVNKGGEQATATPNPKLWSAVVQEQAGNVAQPPQLRSAQANTGKWVEEKGRRRKKKPPPHSPPPRHSPLLG